MTHLTGTQLLAQREREEREARGRRGKGRGIGGREGGRRKGGIRSEDRKGSCNHNAHSLTSLFFLRAAAGVS